MRVLWTVWLIAGCRIGFDPTAGIGDGGADALGEDGDAAPGDARPDGAGACPASYVPLYASHYRAVDNSVTWLAAQAQCEADGQHLVIFDDAPELAAVVPLVAGDDIWVGVTDRVTLGTWRTVTGAIATYLPWSSGEPDLAALERCVEAESPTYGIIDQDCAANRRFVCECDGVPTDPASY